jgi:hypothetical protein
MPETDPGFFKNIGKNKKRIIMYCIPFSILLLLAIIVMLDTSADTAEAEVETDACITCHKASGVMEAVYNDWEKSKHAQNNVTCIDCHLAAQTDPDVISHNGFFISPIVSPKDCSLCHSQVVAEFTQSLHSFGNQYYEFLFDNKKLPYIESQVEGGYIVSEGSEITHAATLRGCQACHGTNMTGKTADDYTVWPNNGIGRINPDGSKGSCAACHSRHTFSVEEARKPETCGQCHMGPDHPQIEIYLESKHGNIYSSEGDTWNWTSEEWIAGVDYRAPTCASCHMSAAPGVAATHDVSSRLSWELETPISRRTDNIANSLGVPFGDGTTWQVKQDRMKKVCRQCHGPTWVDNYYKQADIVVELYNEQYSAAKKIVDELYEDELLTPESFDEPIEFEIYEMWHHEGRRARMGAFMMGPDYVQWHGFYDMLIDRVEIEHMAAEIRERAHNETDDPTHANGDGDEHEDDDKKAIDFESESILWCLTLVILALAIVGWFYVIVTRKKNFPDYDQTKARVVEPGVDETFRKKGND